MHRVMAYKQIFRGCCSNFYIVISYSKNISVSDNGVVEDNEARIFGERNVFAVFDFRYGSYPSAREATLSNEPDLDGEKYAGVIAADREFQRP